MPCLITRGGRPARWRSGRPRRPAYAAPGERRTAAGWAGAILRDDQGERSGTPARPRSPRTAGWRERSSLRSSLVLRSSVRLPCRCSVPSQVLIACDRVMIKAASPAGRKLVCRKTQEVSQRALSLQIAGVLCSAMYCARILGRFVWVGARGWSAGHRESPRHRRERVRRLSSRPPAARRRPRRARPEPANLARPGRRNDDPRRRDHRGRARGGAGRRRGGLLPHPRDGALGRRALRGSRARSRGELRRRGGGRRCRPCRSISAACCPSADRPRRI